MKDPLTRDLPIDLRVLRGRSMTAADKSFGRIRSFDAFHQVADQRAALGEFSCVLTNDAVAALTAPRRYHSLMGPPSGGNFGQGGVVFARATMQARSASRRSPWRFPT